MDCTQCKEALSAQLDGEESGADSGTAEAHLAICGECCRFAEDATRLTMLARAMVDIPQPDLAAELVFTSDGLVSVLQALADLDRESTTCAIAMMALNTAEMVSATRAALDCADIAAAAQRVLSRPAAADGIVLRAILTAAAAAADRCAMECGQHAGHHDHCRVHSETAQRTAEVCRSELANIAG